MAYEEETRRPGIGNRKDVWHTDSNALYDTENSLQLAIDKEMSKTREKKKNELIASVLFGADIPPETRNFAVSLAATCSVSLALRIMNL